MKPKLRKKLKFVIVGCMALWMTLSVSQGICPKEAVAADFDTTEALIELLKEKGIMTEEEAKGFLMRHRKKAAATPHIVTITPQQDTEAYLKKVSEGVTRKVTEDLNDLKKDYEFRSDDLVRRNILLKRKVDQLEEMITEEQKPMLQSSSWAQRIRFGGDIRLRHESVLFDKDNARDIENPNSPGSRINTTNDEHRQRIRLRIGMKAKLIDQTDVNVGKVTAGVRLATGSVNNPVSTNHTLGHSSRDKSDIVLDRAYVKWTYKPEEEIWGNKIPQVSVTGGIMKNPWFSTSLIWDSDLAFEGVAVNLVSDTNEMNAYNGFLTMGYFSLEESEWSQKDKYLVGAQVGFKHRPRYGWNYKLAAGYYDYVNVAGEAVKGTTLSASDLRRLSAMAPKFMQKGNSTFDMSLFDAGNENETYGLLSDFKLLNLTGRVENSLFFPIHVIFYWDWVKNIGYDADEMAAKAEVSKGYMKSVSGDMGYQIGLKVGYPKPRQRWDWNLFCEYRYLETDAVLDAFTDSDFHLGGTNAKGFIFGGELGLYENVWMAARWMSANEIEDMQMFGDTQPDDLAVDTFQFSIHAEF